MLCNVASVFNVIKALGRSVNSVVTRGTGVKVVLPSLAIEFIVDKRFRSEVCFKNYKFYTSDLLL